MKIDPMLAMLGLGGGELILVLTMALLLFGGKKLPELAKGLGQGIKEFKKATSNASEEMRHVVEEAIPAPARQSPPTAVGRQDGASQNSHNSHA